VAGKAFEIMYGGKKGQKSRGGCAGKEKGDGQKENFVKRQANQEELVSTTRPDGWSRLREQAINPWVGKRRKRGKEKRDIMKSARE